MGQPGQLQPDCRNQELEGQERAGVEEVCNGEGQRPGCPLEIDRGSLGEPSPADPLTEALTVTLDN